MDLKHTHRGHCQNCGRIQAIDVLIQTVAKHGYVVAGYHFFNGTCTGSDRKPLELERTYCDSQCTWACEMAVIQSNAAEDYKNGRLTPAMCWNGAYKQVMQPGGYYASEEVEIPYAEGQPYYQKRARDEMVFKHESHASQFISYAANMTRLAKQVHGKELMPVKKGPKPVDIGMTFTASNKCEYKIVKLTRGGIGRMTTYAECQNLTKPDMNNAHFTLRVVRSYELKSAT